MNVLVLNAGSSTLKFQLIDTDLDRIKEGRDERLCRGAVDRIGTEAEFTVQSGETKHSRKEGVADVRAAVECVLDWIRSDGRRLLGLAAVQAVGHRVVHGGELFSESALITDEVLAGIRECVDLAPLHNPKNLEGILAARQFFGPDVPQVAVFDTAFHHTLPQHAYLYALPYSLYQQHRIRRYGFHGTSHRYVAHRYRLLRQLRREQTNVITLHLGNGCSATAIKAGRSVDTSMGMTPLEGLVMGTRSGDIDPGIVEIIAEKQGISSKEVQVLLNSQSGLLGISGLSNDMRELQQRAAVDSHADLAIAIFCYRAKKYIGAFLAAMGGADAIVFTGGIGEHSPAVRAQICSGLEWAGLTLDRVKNESMVGVEGRISGDESTLLGFCIPTDEELLIARDTVRCILGEPHPS
jgi:acetate kinase